MPKQPVYPHIPKSRVTATLLQRERKTDLRFLPDSPEFIAQSITSIGCRERLADVFQKAIARVNRRN